MHLQDTQERGYDLDLLHSVCAVHYDQDILLSKIRRDRIDERDLLCTIRIGDDSERRFGQVGGQVGSVELNQHLDIFVLSLARCIMCHEAMTCLVVRLILRPRRF